MGGRGGWVVVDGWVVDESEVVEGVVVVVDGWWMNPFSPSTQPLVLSPAPTEFVQVPLCLLPQKKMKEHLFEETICHVCCLGGWWIRGVVVDGVLLVDGWWRMDGWRRSGWWWMGWWWWMGGG